ncbi:MAG: zinc ABC transporter ATP-binding protein AztA [Stackebrandtia sp.]
MSQTTTHAVRLSEVTAHYGRVPALRGVSLGIPDGRVTALLGHNGSGKSTLLNVLAGLHRPSSGEVHANHRHRPALVVQRSEATDSLPITVRQTVAMGRWAHRAVWRRASQRDKEIVNDCLQRLGMAELAETPLGRLSGGQRQRALLAQGLAQQSDLLLLDEPATGLDTATAETLAELLPRLSESGVTIVHATHDAQLAARADHCVSLSRGRLADTGERG